MKNKCVFFILPAILVAISACNTSTPVIQNEAAYIGQWQQWQKRLEGLKDIDGWLNLQPTL